MIENVAQPDNDYMTLRDYRKGAFNISLEDTLLLIHQPAFFRRAGHDVLVEEYIPDHDAVLWLGCRDRSIDEEIRTILQELLTVLGNLPHNYVVVLGKSDTALDDEVASSLPPNVLRVYGNNLVSEDPRLQYLPMGRDFRSRADFMKIQPSSERTIQCYCNFSVNTHPVRRHIQTLLAEKHFVTFENMGHFGRYSLSRYDFLARLANSEFAVCPRGNAVETFRFWDCLYLGTIPIVVYEGRFHDELKDLPVLFLESPEEFATLDKERLLEVREEMLERTYNFNKLRLSYWLNRIDSDAGQLLAPAAQGRPVGRAAAFSPRVAQTYLAEIYIAEGHLSRALTVAEREIARNPRNFRIRVLLIRLQACRGRLVAAVRHGLAAAFQVFDDPALRAKLGKRLIPMGSNG